VEVVLRRSILTLLVAAAFGVFAQSALAGPPSLSFAGGSDGERASVRSALAASTFDWSLLPRAITVHIGVFGDSYATPGDVYLDGSLLDAGRFSWGVVQHEFAHQVDFLLLDDSKRALLAAQLGADDWCGSAGRLPRAAYGCERFASELAWAYWPSPDNAMSPAFVGAESRAVPVTQFRALLAQMLGVPSLARLTEVKAYAPPKKKRR
jgi:hypothetical protein